MPKVDVNLKRGYEASVPVEKIWRKFESGEIDRNFCIPIGEDENKKDVFFDIVRGHHILAAGVALSGAGMFRRVALATLLKFNKAEDLKFILIDPLKISFFHFKNIEERLVFPIIRENEEALKALEWAREEMERRYAILIENGVMNIKGYNEKNPSSKLPRIVIMITEFGELMDFNGEAIEGLIIRIAQMAKAVGINFVLTTQRPSNNVITSLIKSNMPAVIAFQMSTEDDSELVISKKGAEKLLGQGDMFFSSFDSLETLRLQGYCLEEEAVENIKFK
jgi:DNA segregation ATPase FtsK/SpoIIIE, S-DNA-T family